MVYTGFWESNTALKAMYGDFLDPVCTKFDLTRAQIDILLFLLTNPDLDTATDIVQSRRLTKSHISISLRDLVDRGFIERDYRDGNRKTVHLVMTERAKPVLEEGRKAQIAFSEALFEGISDDVRKALLEGARIMQDNARLYFRRKKTDTQE